MLGKAEGQHRRSMVWHVYARRQRHGMRALTRRMLAAMKVARQPETGRHYPSDRCPVASDGKGEGEREEGKGKRGKELTNWQALHAKRHIWRYTGIRQAARRKRLRQRTRETTTSSKSTPPTRPKTED